MMAGPSALFAWSAFATPPERHARRMRLVAMVAGKEVGITGARKSALPLCSAHLRARFICGYFLPLFRHSGCRGRECAWGHPQVYSDRRSPPALQHPRGASGGVDPQTGRPAKVIGGRAVGADTARPAVDWHLCPPDDQNYRCDSTVPGRGTGVSHPADTPCVGFPTVPPSSAHRRGREPR